MRSPKLGSLLSGPGFCSGKLIGGYLKAQKSGAQPARVSAFTKSRYSRGLQTECWTMVS